MLNNFESEDDKMRMYYSYIKTLGNINQNLICEVPDLDLIKVTNFFKLETSRRDRSITS